MKIIKYGANWCGPCRMMSELLKKSGYQFDEIDVDSNAELLEGKNIRNIPYIEVLDNNNNIVYTHAGALTAAELKELGDKYDS